MILDIVTYDDIKLKEKSLPVGEVNTDIRRLVKDMFETMYVYNGIGLAAIQVGITRRLFIVDVPGGGKHVIIDPVVKKLSKKRIVYEEGCLSIPGIVGDVERSNEIELEYTDLKNNRKILKAKGLLSVCFQHELDHLEGVLFVDRMPLEDRIVKIKEYRKLYKV